MKRLFIISAFALISLAAYSQKFRFNKKLNNFCFKSTLEFEKIPADRKASLDKIAQDLSTKKNIVFSCYTNTRRTQLLQTWAQAAFYYYAIYNKTAFSYGDTISEIAPGVVSVLKKSGFVFSGTNTKPKAWVFYIGERNEGYVIYPKKVNKLPDEKESTMVSICVEGEPVSDVGPHAYSLPYVSPVPAEKTSEEKAIYDKLNKQVSIEMLYLVEKTRDIMMNSSR